MNDMYRDRDYRMYRDDYKDDYRDDYKYRYNRDRTTRNYREKEEYYDMLNDAMEDGVHLARMYEDIAEMTSNSKDKNSLLKIAEREKEHYRAIKEMIEHSI